MRKPTVRTPCTGTLTNADTKILIETFPIVATTDDAEYNIHGFTKEGDTENILLSRNTHKRTTYHKVRIHHHKYQTDTFTIGDKTYNMDKLQEV